MKISILLLSLLLSTLSIAQDRGFTESQLVYAKERGQTHFSLEWDEEKQVASISHQFNLTNYREDWHSGGFNLSKASTGRIVFPNVEGDCKLTDVEGMIPHSPAGKKRGHLNYKLAGPDCALFLDLYKLFGVTLTLYEVPSLDDTIFTPVVRIFFMDAP